MTVLLESITDLELREVGSNVCAIILLVTTRSLVIRLSYSHLVTIQNMHGSLPGLIMMTEIF